MVSCGFFESADHVPVSVGCFRARQPPGPYLRITAPGDQPRACVSTVGLTGRTPRRRLTASPGRLERLRPAPTAASFSARPGTPTQFQLLAIEPFALTTLTPFAPDPVSVHSSHVGQAGGIQFQGRRSSRWLTGRPLVMRLRTSLR